MIKKFIINMAAIDVKPKSVIIDGNLHNRFKVLCKGKSLKIGGVIEDLIRVYLSNPKEMQEMINDYKEKHEPKITV